jgi:hypothetical protein
MLTALEYVTRNMCTRTWHCQEFVVPMTTIDTELSF